MSAEWFLLLLCLLQRSAADRVVMTGSGPLQGVSQTAEVEAFLGIPYAEPPVGRLRFRRPVPKSPWSGVLDASRLPPPCVQNGTERLYYMPEINDMSEDCLFLNVWTPAGAFADGRPRPVLFFLHGGAFNIGASNMAVYDGAKMAARGDLVVVTINYRLGAMGFFSAFIEGAAGNMGLYDQVLALRWVRANALSFGGDPEHVVLMGESAGAMCVSGHLTSPLTRGLFRRAILQSGADVSPIILDDNARLRRTSQALARLAGCADGALSLRSDPRRVVDCLRRQPAAELARLEGLMMRNNPITFFPRVGDEYMPRASVHAYREGRVPRTELLVGVNEREGTFFLSAAAPQYFGVYGAGNAQNVGRRLAHHMTRAVFRGTEQRGAEAEIAEFYVDALPRNASSDEHTQAIARALGDWLIHCAAVFCAELNALAGNDVYFYVFRRRPDSTPLAEWMGATHFDEVQYVFGNPLHQNFTRAEEDFSRRTMDRWIAFAKTGNPNVPDAVRWEPYRFEYPAYLELDGEESVRLRPAGHRCEFWRSRFQAGLDLHLLETLRRGRSSAAAAAAATPSCLAALATAALWLGALSGKRLGAAV